MNFDLQGLQEIHFFTENIRFPVAIAIYSEWEKIHPDIDLHFADWDCYVSAPEPALDVFVFDGIYLTSFVNEGYLLPISDEMIQNKEDIFPFALEGCKCNDTIYALTQLLCTDFLYTRKDDTFMELKESPVFSNRK